MRFLRALGASESLKMSISIVLPVPTPPGTREQGVTAEAEAASGMLTV